MQKLCESNRKSKLPSPPIPCVKCIGKPMKNSWRISEYSWKVRKTPKKKEALGNRGSKKAENSQEMLGKATFRNILEDFGKFWDILKKANLGRSWKKQEEKVTFLRERKISKDSGRY